MRYRHFLIKQLIYCFYPILFLFITIIKRFLYLTIRHFFLNLIIHLSSFWSFHLSCLTLKLSFSWLTLKSRKYRFSLWGLKFLMSFGHLKDRRFIIQLYCMNQQFIWLFWYIWQYGYLSKLFHIMFITLYGQFLISY